MTANQNLYDQKYTTEKTLSVLYGDHDREIRTVTSEDGVEQVDIIIHGEVIAVSVWVLKPSLVAEYKRELVGYFYDDVSQRAHMDQAVAYYKQKLLKQSRKRHYDALENKSKKSKDLIFA